jgi:hypothetical protein
MSNPADEHIIDLIEHLSVLARKITTSAEERQICITQIAQLRTSMTTPILVEKKD